jgi:hypothetical protein
MKKFNVMIKGVTPLLFNKPPEYQTREAKQSMAILKWYLNRPETLLEIRKRTLEAQLDYYLWGRKPA